MNKYLIISLKDIEFELKDLNQEFNITNSELIQGKISFIKSLLNHSPQLDLSPEAIEERARQAEGIFTKHQYAAYRKALTDLIKKEK